MVRKVGIVTGAASGIGRACATRLASAGWAVALVDRDEEAVRAVAAELSAQAETLALAADVSRGAEVRASVAAVGEQFGRIDGLVNSAAITLLDDDRIESVDEDVFDAVIRVNLRGVFLFVKAALPWLRCDGGGSIVNMASAAAFRGTGGPAYTASKGGVVAMTRVIAYQNAQDLVRCNAICPGPIETPMFEVTQQKASRGPWAPPPGTIPRIGQPGDVAGLVEFLLSDGSTWITGSTFSVDGGVTGH